MTRQLTSLNGGQWSFGQVPRRAFAAPQVYDLPAVSEWLPATVPGNVRTDLLALGRIPDPFENEQYKDSLWVETVDWWYRRAVAVESPVPWQRAFIIFNGIDYRSAIFINEQELARHEGMFSRQVVEISELVWQQGGPLELAVRLWGSSGLPGRRLNPAQRLWQKLTGKLYRSWVGIYPDRTATLKCQMSYGWDFAPPIRTMGIWDDVALLLTGPVVIQELGIRSQELGIKGQGVEARGQGRLELSLRLDSLVSTPAVAAVTLTPANFAGEAHGLCRFSLTLPAGQSNLTLRCPLPEVNLWQPWDRGFPHLYTVTVTLTEPDGRPLAEASGRTGFRSIEKRGWRFLVNDQPEFMRGLNWAPADSFPGRLRRSDYQRLLTQARDSGANLLRVWGGGLREKAAFYDLCDELGLLVWQEFPFACEFLGAFPREAAYLNFVAEECGDIVRQLRHHPSLLLWCGGNEFSRRRNQPLLRTLAATVRQLDGTRPFVPVSPAPAHGGDAHHWRVWHGLAPFQAYQQETAAFLSEFGLQALPGSMKNENLEMSSLPARYGDPKKLARYANLFNEQAAMSREQLVRGNEPESKLKTLHFELETQNAELKTLNSQLAQAVGLQTAIEHMRRRSGEAGGLCVWQFNEPWPAVSWAIIDYAGQPKLAYDRLKTWYRPILVSLEFPVGQRWQPGDCLSAGIWLINDTLQPLPPVALQVTLTTPRASLIIHQSSVTNIPPHSARCVGQLSHRFDLAPVWLTATVRQGETVLSENHYPLAWHDEHRAGVLHRFRRQVAEWALW